MTDPAIIRARVLKIIEENGEAEVRRLLKAGRTYGERLAPYLEAEFESRDRARNDSSQSEQIDIARSARDAAWAAAEAAREANELARQANQQAKRANTISIIAIVIAIAAIIVSTFVSLNAPPKTTTGASAASAASSFSDLRSASASRPAPSSARR